MAGKSSKGKNKRGSHNFTDSSEPVASSDSILSDSISTLECSKTDFNRVISMEEAFGEKLDSNGSNHENSPNEAKQGEVRLYPISVKTQGGQKLELQLNPGDSVMDLRQFLLDSPETCFFTCYNLLLHKRDGSVHQIDDYDEISEVVDITTSGYSFEMAAALYDDRSIRAHVHRTRELLSLSSLHGSLSTSLAPQPATTQDVTGSIVKSEFKELDGLGFMEDVMGSLHNVLASSTKEIKCVESIGFSFFNPPPSYRRLVGDLIYLDVVTLDNNKYCITGSTRTFYVNLSTGNILDPRPSKVNCEATTLIGLLQKLNSKFKKAFHEILEQKACSHPFENVQSLLSPNSWLGCYPFPDHKHDAARAENALTLSYGSELIGMQRDWNEELQSFRDFPHTTPQERILRDRVLYKVTADFVGAAINGAIGVVRRCISPINPTDPEGYHMYLHNNIFFSFALDSDVEQLSKKQSVSNITSKIKSVGSVTGLSAKASNNGDRGISNGENSVSSTLKQFSNVTSLTPEVFSEMQLADSEQATYASANNDLKGTRAYQEADVPGLYNLSMAIIDYRGYRVVAQSALPGILQGDKSDSLMYGSVDNGKKIYWNEDFHAKVLEASRHLHLKEHAVFDGSGNICRLAAPLECKGIVGSDNRHYLLDLIRVTPRDANYTGHGSRFCILRSELITAFCQAEVAKSKIKLETKGEVQEKTIGIADTNSINDVEKTEENIEHVASDSQEINKEIDNTVQECHQTSDENSDYREILFNPNVFTDFNLSGSQEEIAADEEIVRKASLYLTDTVLPKFIQDLCMLEISPMDGQTLTESLHSHGINIRYIGKVANGTKHLPHLWDLCSNEVVVRSTKHIFKDILRDTEDHDLGPSISHFFNCFFGNCPALVKSSAIMQNGTRKKDQSSLPTHGKNSRGHARSKGGASERGNCSTYMNLNSESLWSDIIELAKFKYQFDVPEDTKSRVKKVSVVRNLCQKVGITIAARKYDFDTATPFQTVDILNLQPVVKHSVPVCSEVKGLVKEGKDKLAEGMLSEAYTLFYEAFSILQQVTGPMHRDVADCCRYLAMVLYHAGDMAGAITQQHMELIINERCLGLDHPDTAHSYGNMALFYHGMNQTEVALQHMSRALQLLSLSSGMDHPDVAATFINVAMMYQEIGKMDTALRFLQESLNKTERLLGKEHIQTAVCFHALAVAFNSMGAFKLSHQNEKKTYDILVKQLGEEDSRSRDAQNWMNAFKKREIQANLQKVKGQALSASSTQKAVDYLKTHPDVLYALSGGSGSSSSTANNSLNTGQIHVDARAARATAGVRKKVAAKGLLVKQPRFSAQSLLPQFTKLLDVINSGIAPSAFESNGSNQLKKKSNASNEKPDAKEDQAPVGLGRVSLLCIPRSTSQN